MLHFQRAVFILLILLAPSISAQRFLSGQYLTTKNGLTNNKINCLRQDTRGYLWVGTEEGLTRFNGVVFEKYFADINHSKRALSSNFIKYILQVNDSLMLISTSSGVNVFNIRTDRFENSLINDSLIKAGSGADITAISKLKGNKNLVATNHKIFILDEKFKTIKAISTKSKSGEHFHFSQNHIFLDRDSTKILFCKGKFGGSGILDLDNDSISSAVSKFSFLSAFETTPFGPIYRTGEDEFFYSAYSYGFFIHSELNGTSYHFDIAKSSGEFNTVNMILPDAGLPGTYWLATGSGLFKLDRPSKKIISFSIGNKTTERLSGRGNCILIDNEKNLWFGTANGLYMFTRNAMLFEKFFELEKQEVMENGINTCYEDEKGRIWLGTYGSGLFQIDLKNLDRNPISFTECGFYITKIKPMKNNMYLSSERGLMYYHEAARKFLFYAFYPDTLKQKIVTDFHCDESGVVRFGLGNGLGMTEIHEKENTVVRLNHYHYGKADWKYLPIRQPTFLVEDKNQNLWGGYNYGDKLMFYNRIKKTYTTVMLTVQASAYDYFSVSSMFVDSKNRLWMGTYNLGLLVHDINSGNTKSITRSQGLPSEICNEITEDVFGNIWIATNSGLAKCESETDRILSFTSREGLPVEQIVWMKYMVRESDTVMLLGDYQSAFSLNPHHINFNSDVPEIYITKVSAGNNPMSNWQSHYKHHENNFRFEFIGISLINGEKNQYEYKLLPIDKEWIKSGTIRTASYNNLPPGHYNFLVKCSNGAGLWSNEKNYSFRIAAAFWQTWWFKTYVMLAVLLVVYYIYRIRLKRTIEIEKMRVRISRDLHDDIGSTLSSINILSRATLSAKGKDPGLNADETLKKINSMSQNMLDSMDDIIWSIKPENDSGSSILTRMREYATQILDASEIDIAFDFDERIDSITLSMECKRSLYLIFKEAVNNLVKYSRSEKAWLKIGLKNDLIEMRIEDTGIGFNANDVKSGNGILNMKKRAADVNAELIIESTVGKGTNLVMKMKY